MDSQYDNMFGVLVDIDSCIRMYAVIANAGEFQVEMLVLASSCLFESIEAEQNL